MVFQVEHEYCVTRLTALTRNASPHRARLLVWMDSTRRRRHCSTPFKPGLASRLYVSLPNSWLISGSLPQLSFVGKGPIESKNRYSPEERYFVHRHVPCFAAGIVDVHFLGVCALTIRNNIY